MFQNIEKIVSNENHILLCGNLLFKNVKLNGNPGDIEINRWFRIIDDEKMLYVVEIAHCPQTDPDNAIWQQLKLSFESFRIIKK